MGEVARIHGRWHAPVEPMLTDRRPLTFESFFEDERERLLRSSP
jgi:hypothetical protein